MPPKSLAAPPSARGARGGRGRPSGKNAEKNGSASRSVARRNESPDPFESITPQLDVRRRPAVPVQDSGSEGDDASLDAFMADVGLDDELAATVGPVGRTGQAGADKPDRAGEEQQELSIPQKLLTRLLHEHFKRDKTRVTKAADAALAKYVDVFVREAIARAAAEREGGFLEVEDLEKISPQLLLDL